MMTPLEEAWNPASVRPPQPGTKIPFVDYAADLGDLKHYCGKYKSACKPPPQQAGFQDFQPPFDGVRDDDLNGYFIPFAAPGLAASFDHPPTPVAAAPQQPAPPAAQDAPPQPPAAPPAAPAPKPIHLAQSPELVNLALFVIAGLLLLFAIHHFACLGSDIARLRIAHASLF